MTMDKFYIYVNLTSYVGGSFKMPFYFLFFFFTYDYCLSDHDGTHLRFSKEP